MILSQQSKGRFAVVACTDSKMVPLACAVLYSAHLASPDIEFDKILIGLDIHHEQELQILEFAKQNNFSIKTILLKRAELGPVVNKYGAATLRLRMDNHIKERYDRILYLDCDIMVIESLSTLFQINLQGNTAAAVADLMKPWKGNHDRLKELGVSFGNYFNSGVILFDMSKANASRIWERTESELERRAWRRADQDVLNKVLASQWLRLPIKWNFTNPFHYRKSIKPAIVHFAGGGFGGRPWYRGSIRLHRKYKLFYINTFANTPWSDFIPESTLWERIQGEYRYYLSTIRRHFPVGDHLKQNNFVI
jgi:lipopolysaccharide biosynthesis glycosyltransferase